MHKADQKFSQWCKEHGFGDIKARVRSAAMWLAGNWSEVTTDLDCGLTHPVNIQEWHREQQQAPAPSPDLDLNKPSKVRQHIDISLAKRGAKVAVGELEELAVLRKTANRLRKWC